MNTKVLIIFFVVLAVLLALPIVSGILRATGTPQGEVREPDAPKAPPLLNATNLAGTAWRVKTDEMPIAVTINLNPGGYAVATVPAMFAAIARRELGTDVIQGTWSVQGDQLIAEVAFKGKTHTVACDIIGDKLFYENKEIPRIM